MRFSNFYFVVVKQCSPIGWRYDGLKGGWGYGGVTVWEYFGNRYWNAVRQKLTVLMVIDRFNDLVSENLWVCFWVCRNKKAPGRRIFIEVLAEI